MPAGFSLVDTVTLYHCAAASPGKRSALDHVQDDQGDGQQHDRDEFPDPGGQQEQGRGDGSSDPGRDGDDFRDERQMPV